MRHTYQTNMGVLMMAPMMFSLTKALATSEIEYGGSSPSATVSSLFQYLNIQFFRYTAPIVWGGGGGGGRK